MGSGGAECHKATGPYADKALAILNHWNADEVREVLGTGALDDACDNMREEKKAAEERRRDDEMIASHPDLEEKVGNGELSSGDALGAAAFYGFNS